MGTDYTDITRGIAAGATVVLADLAEAVPSSSTSTRFGPRAGRFARPGGYAPLGPLHHPQRGDEGEVVEVDVVVQQRTLRANAHRRDEAVGSAPYRQPFPPGGAVDLSDRCVWLR